MHSMIYCFLVGDGLHFVIFWQWGGVWQWWWWCRWRSGVLKGLRQKLTHSRGGNHLYYMYLQQNIMKGWCYEQKNRSDNVQERIIRVILHREGKSDFIQGRKGQVAIYRGGKSKWLYTGEDFIGVDNLLPGVFWLLNKRLLQMQYRNVIMLILDHYTVHV